MAEFPETKVQNKTKQNKTKQNKTKQKSHHLKYNPSGTSS